MVIILVLVVVKMLEKILLRMMIGIKSVMVVFLNEDRIGGSLLCGGVG